ncbi:MAG: amidohydrolase family protein [Myxococcota bacterium]|jgi:N-acyl-D-amino-acid deacylase|nr:amidohydrolase family protein [Myxococcota bacterium]
MYDLIVRNGLIVDGSGAPPRSGDIAVQEGRIVAVGRVEGAAREEIDASGLAVTPGFVDVHTHYDGQVTWDAQLSPSCWHGVTTAVFGNCGVGFAPVRPDERDYLISLMESVEDIPGTALAEGIEWEWETFPEFMDAVGQRELGMDVAAQVPHGAVRTYVMGKRGAENEPATPEDIEQMAEIVRDGMEAGALGFSTSRTIMHKAASGDPMPGTFAAEDELFGIGRVLGELDKGIFELAPVGAAGEDAIGARAEMEWMRRLSAEIGRPVSFAMLQVDAEPTLWRDLLDESQKAVAEGAQVYPQIAGRPFGMLVGHQTEYHPFRDRPSYEALLELPFPERIARLREPEVREQILSEQVEYSDPLAAYVMASFQKLFPLGEKPNYEPAYEDSIAGIAEREGRKPEEVLYDCMLGQDGLELLLFPLLNYSDGNCDAIYEMLHHPRAALGLGDGGAHCGIICDASIPTFMLSHWVRDRTRGPKLPIELVVKRMTSDSAKLYGLLDRGLIEPGYKADLNLIDLDSVGLKLPEMVFDLPAGGRRLIQRADGYRMTIVGGEVTMRDGMATGALPGRLVRGEQSPPGELAEA